MKEIIKKLGKNTVFVVIAALLAGSSLTVGVFAAIPHSTTGVITACRTNLTGALRIIDAESGATCNGLETTLSWGTASSDTNSALLQLDPDPSHDYTYVMNAGHSRNILDVKTVDDPDPGNTDAKYLCIKVAFNPEMKTAGAATQQLGGGAAIDIKLASDSSTMASGITTLCGSGYNALTFLDVNTEVTLTQKVFFTN